MDLKELRENRQKYLDELIGLSDWVVGSLVETEQKRNGKRIPFRYLSHSVDGRNKITYISENQMPLFRDALRNGIEARRLLEEIANLTAQIIKVENKRGKK